MTIRIAEVAERPGSRAPPALLRGDRPPARRQGRRPPTASTTTGRSGAPAVRAGPSAWVHARGDRRARRRWERDDCPRAARLRGLVAGKLVDVEARLEGAPEVQADCARRRCARDRPARRPLRLDVRVPGRAHRLTIGDDEVDDRRRRHRAVALAATSVERTGTALLLRFPGDRADVHADVRGSSSTSSAAAVLSFVVVEEATSSFLRWDGPPEAGALLDRLDVLLRSDEPGSSAGRAVGPLESGGRRGSVPSADDRHGPARCTAARWTSTRPSCIARDLPVPAGADLRSCPSSPPARVDPPCTPRRGAGRPSPPRGRWPRGGEGAGVLPQVAPHLPLTVPGPWPPVTR